MASWGQLADGLWRAQAKQVNTASPETAETVVTDVTAVTDELRSPCKGGRTRTRRDAAGHASNISSETNKERNKAAEGDGGGSLKHERPTAAAHENATALGAQTSSDRLIDLEIVGVMHRPSRSYGWGGNRSGSSRRLRFGLWKNETCCHRDGDRSPPRQ